MGIDKDKRIEELEATVAKLLARIAELERRLGTDSTNSSKPPSSDPPGAKSGKNESAKRKAKKRGAKKGHAKQNKALLPEEDVTRFVELPPEVCPSCGESAVRLHRGMGYKRMTGMHFWARGDCVSTVGLDEETIRQYIREQEKLESDQQAFDFE